MTSFMRNGGSSSLDKEGIIIHNHLPIIHKSDQYMHDGHNFYSHSSIFQHLIIIIVCCRCTAC